MDDQLVSVIMTDTEIAALLDTAVFSADDIAALWAQIEITPAELRGASLP